MTFGTFWLLTSLVALVLSCIAQYFDYKKGQDLKLSTALMILTCIVFPFANLWVSAIALCAIHDAAIKGKVLIKGKQQ